MQPHDTTQHPLALARDQIDDALSPQDWSDIWKSMLDLALHAPNTRDRINATRLLCEYRFGKPVPAAPPKPTEEQTHPIPQMPVPADHPDYPYYWSKTLIVEHGGEDEGPPSMRQRPSTTAQSTQAAPPPN